MTQKRNLEEKTELKSIKETEKRRGIKKYLIYLMVTTVITSTIFVACKKDNDDDDDDNNSGLVSRIIYTNWYTYDYRYDAQNRISSIHVSRNGNEFDINYTYPSANTIRYTMGEEPFIFVYTATLDKDGRIIKINTPDFICVDNFYYLGDDQWGDAFLNVEYVFEYENSYLTKVTEVGLVNSEDYTENYVNSTTNYVWENGNLKSEQWRYTNGDTSTYTYSYGTIPDKETNISIWSRPTFNYFSPAACLCFPAKCFGKRSQSLISQEVIPNGATIKYRFVTNAKGYVTQMYSNTWDSEKESLWIQVQYK